MTKQIEVSEAEYHVLQALWQSSPDTAKALLERLNNDWHLKTLNTLLSRLVKKGAISYVKSGREYLYSPELQQENYVKSQSNRFIEKILNGRLSPLVAHFAEHNSLQQDDIEALKKIIDNWEQQK